jgi:hypothetical protein
MIIGSKPFSWPTVSEILIAVIESPPKIKTSYLAMASKLLPSNQGDVDRKTTKIEYTIVSIVTFSALHVSALAGYLLDRLLLTAYSFLRSAEFVSLGVTKASDKRQRAIAELRKEFQHKVHAMNKKIDGLRRS